MWSRVYGRIGAVNVDEGLRIQVFTKRNRTCYTLSKPEVTDIRDKQDWPTNEKKWDAHATVCPQVEGGIRKGA